MDTTVKTWFVCIDGEFDSAHETRAKARACAAWWRRHPAVVDRRVFGHGGRVEVHS